MNLSYRSLCLILLLSLTTLPATAEDLTVVSSVTTGRGAPMTATQYLANNKMRTSDGRTDTILDVASGRMVQIDHKKKTYWESSLAEMRQHLAGLPMMAGMLGGMHSLHSCGVDHPHPGGFQQRGVVTSPALALATVEVTKDSGSREVAGYTCDQYHLTLGRRFQFELWAARDLKAPTQYYDAKKMIYATMGPMASRFDKMYEEMKKIDGFPLYTKIETRMLGMKTQSVSEATEVRKGPIPADVFEPPAGYKKKKSPYEKRTK